MTPDPFTALLEDLLVDVEQVAAKLARLDGIAAVSDQAKEPALALAAATSAIARDAALIFVSLETSAEGLRHFPQDRSRLS